MHLGSSLKKYQRLKVLKGDDNEHQQGKSMLFNGSEENHMIDLASFSQEALRRGLVAPKQTVTHHSIDIQTSQDPRRNGGLPYV